MLAFQEKNNFFIAPMGAHRSGLVRNGPGDRGGADLRRDAAVTARMPGLRWSDRFMGCLWCAIWARLDCGGGRSSENASCPYILSHRVWSDWVIFLKILADLSWYNLVDERGC